MIDSHNVNSLFGAPVVAPDGSKIGTVKHVYVDPDGGHPLFVGVPTGLFGTAESFVPLGDADFDGEVLHVQYDKDTIKHAPRIDADGTLTDEEIDRIHDYYEHGTGEDAVAERDDARDDEPRRRARLERYVVAERDDGIRPLTREEVTTERLAGEGSHIDTTSELHGHDGGPLRRDRR